MPMTANPEDEEIDRALRVIVLAGFISMYSMRFCDAMLPEFSQIFHLTTGQAAQALSWYAMGYGLMQLVSGGLAERLGKVATVRWCLLGCAVGALICGLAYRFEMLLFGRFLTGFSSGGIIPMIIAWLGDNVPTHQRQARLATLMSATVMGTMTGQWSGGIIVSWVGWHNAFYALSVLFLLIAWRLQKIPNTENISSGPADTFWTLSLAHVQRVQFLLRDARARWVLMLGLVEGLLTYSTIAFLPTHLHLSLGLSVAVAGGVLAFYSVGGFLYARNARRLLTMFVPKQLIWIGTALQMVGFLGIAFSPVWQLDILLCLLTGFGLLMVHNAIQLQATEISTQRGIGVSMFVLMIFLGQTINAWLGGQIIDSVSSQWVFCVAAVGSIFVSWMLLTHLKKEIVTTP
jgi:predicted MFS family arabinose efflux permease